MSTAGAKQSDLAPGDRLVTIPQGEPKLTLGYEVWRWAAKYLRHPNGPRTGKRWKFVESQIRFLLWWYAVDEDGRWIFDHGARRLPKGSGKSPFAAVLALTEFCGPVLLRDFDPDLHGGCKGKPVEMPWVQISATAESQTANTMRMVRALAPKGSRVVEDFNLDPGKTKYHKLPEGTLEVITSSETAAEGAEASFIVADETEHWKPSNGGPGLMSTLIDNVTKSSARLLETSNAWVPGIESVAEDTYDSWVAQEEGEYKEEAARILYDARIAPPDTDLSDADSLRAGLKFVYDDCFWQDIPTIMGRIWSPKARPDDMKRKYLNRPTAAEDAWIDPAEWQLCRDDVEVPVGSDIVAFFDGSKSRDATVLQACHMDTGHVFNLGTWEPNRTGATVDAGDVDRTVRKMFTAYNVIAFFADVKEWESFALTEWPNRYKDDLLIWSAPNARPPQSIAWDMRGHKVEFARAAEACHAEIVERKFTHDGNSRVSVHVGNARQRAHGDHISIDKESPDSPRKIDGAVCVVGVRMLYRLVLNSDKYKKRSGKVW